MGFVSIKILTQLCCGWQLSLASSIFFQEGEITVPLAELPLTRLSTWHGDIPCDYLQHPSSIRVYLKWSKCDQFGRGVAIFLGRTADALCPVMAIIAYATKRGDTSGPFSASKMEHH